MQNLVNCAADLGCLDKVVKDTCKQMADARCSELDCEGAPPESAGGVCRVPVLGWIVGKLGQCA